MCTLYCMSVPLSTPRLPVASYKNSFSMTEWRIRLEGNDQSSGTPFKDTLLPLPLDVCPLCGVHWAVFPLPRSHCNRKLNFNVGYDGTNGKQCS